MRPVLLAKQPDLVYASYASAFDAAAAGTTGAFGGAMVAFARAGRW